MVWESGLTKNKVLRSDLGYSDTDNNLSTMIKDFWYWETCINVYQKYKDVSQSLWNA